MRRAPRRWRGRQRAPHTSAPPRPLYLTDDFRLFVGDLGNEVNDAELCAPFRGYRSFAKGRVVRDKRTHKTRGYGFVSFLEPSDALAAMKDMQGKYIGNRPVRIKRGDWTEKSLVEVKKRERTRERRGGAL